MGQLENLSVVYINIEILSVLQEKGSYEPSYKTHLVMKLLLPLLNIIFIYIFPILKRKFQRWWSTISMLPFCWCHLYIFVFTYMYSKYKLWPWHTLCADNDLDIAYILLLENTTYIIVLITLNNDICLLTYVRNFIFF